MSEEEVQEIFGRPAFSENERKHYFALGENDRVVFESLRGPGSKTLFRLQMAYFKASHQFFSFEWRDVQADLRHLEKRYSIQVAPDKRMPSKNTRLQQRKWILQNHNFRSFSPQEHRLIVQKSQHLVKIHAQPRFVMTELLRMLEDERVSVPGYSTFQKIIGLALGHEHERLNSIIDVSVPGEVKISLNDLLTIEGDFYKLTALKRRAKGFTLTQIKQEIDKHKTLSALYQFTQAF